MTDDSIFLDSVQMHLMQLRSLLHGNVKATHDASVVRQLLSQINFDSMIPKKLAKRIQGQEKATPPRIARSEPSNYDAFSKYKMNNRSSTRSRQMQAAYLADNRDLQKKIGRSLGTTHLSIAGRQFIHDEVQNCIEASMSEALSLLSQDLQLDSQPVSSSARRMIDDFVEKTLVISATELGDIYQRDSSEDSDSCFQESSFEITMSARASIESCIDDSIQSAYQCTEDLFKNEFNRAPPSRPTDLSKLANDQSRRSRHENKAKTIGAALPKPPGAASSIGSLPRLTLRSPAEARQTSNTRMLPPLTATAGRGGARGEEAADTASRRGARASPPRRRGA